MADLDRRFGDLGAREAQKLVRDAVSSGVLRAGLVLMAMAGALVMLLTALGASR